MTAKFMKKIDSKLKVLRKVSLIVLIFSLGAGSSCLYLNKLKPANRISQTIEKDDYLAFLSEVYEPSAG